MKRPVKHLDLPKYHLNGEHYVPAPARQSDEIERRRSLPRGTLLYEQQRDGLAVMHHIVRGAEDERDFVFIQNVLAACALNSSWYTEIRDSKQMRGVLKLSDLFDPTTGERRSQADLRADAEAQLGVAVELADGLVEAHMEGKLKPRQLFVTSRAIGQAAVRVADLSLDPSVYNLNPVEASIAVREHQLATLGQARELVDEFGVNGSIAQLADPDSEVSVHTRRRGTTNVYNLFEEATEERNVA